MHSTTRSPARLLLAIVLVVSVPAAARAQIVSTGDFGHHGASTFIDDLVLMPIGRDECDDIIPFDFTALALTPTSRVIDVWRSSSSTTCAVASSRQPGSPCTWVSLEPGVSERGPATSSFTMGVTARELFGGCTSGTATFWFFNTTSSPDEATTFVGPIPTVHIALDVDPPSSPTIPSSVSGDDEIDLVWANPPDLPEATAMFVYFDPAGCSADDAGVARASSSVLVAGAAAPRAQLATEDFFPYDHTMVGLAAASFGWSSGHYGEQGAIAITVLDSAHNESALSNVVCIAHVPTTTVEAGTMPDAGAGDGRYLIRACSIGGRPQPLATLPLGAALLLAACRARITRRRSLR